MPNKLSIIQKQRVNVSSLAWQVPAIFGWLLITFGSMKVIIGSTKFTCINGNLIHFSESFHWFPTQTDQQHADLSGFNMKFCPKIWKQWLFYLPSTRPIVRIITSSLFCQVWLQENDWFALEISFLQMTKPSYSYHRLTMNIKKLELVYSTVIYYF